MLAWSQLVQKQTFEKNAFKVSCIIDKHLTSQEVGPMGTFVGETLESVIVVVFCKKLSQYVVGNISFYKGNEWACDDDSESTFLT